MKLYLYDHCPFCVRAEMVAGWRHVSLEKVYLLNDDEQAHFDLIGAKLVPILQFDDGRAMGESLDIVAELDQIDTGALRIDPWNDVDSQRAQLSEAGHHISCLLFPRNVRLGLPEFATHGAIAYFTARKEPGLGRSFEQAMAETPTHLGAVQAMLNTMAPVTPPADALRMGDVLLFPVLRNLTMVKDLVWPDWAHSYVTQVAEMTGVATYRDRAI